MSAETINSPYRTRKEAAEYFRRNDQTIDRWIRCGVLETKAIAGGRARLITWESMQRAEVDDCAENH